MIRVAIIALIVLGACGPSNTTPSSAVASGSSKRGSIAVDSDRFPHGVHTGDKPEIRQWQGRGLGCVDCHDAASVRAGKVARPGGTREPAVNQHAPCDDCHKAEFGKAPGKMCKVCHVSVDAFAKGNSPMQAYPERGATQTLASTFSHQLHLDKGKMESASGSHVGCNDCHERDKARDPAVAGHRACARCHEQAAKIKAVLPMDKCAGCHPQRNVELTRGRRFIIGDLKFAHATHEKDRAGQPIACQTCHEGVDDSATREDMKIPAMERCAQCHEDSGRTPNTVRMDNCAVCHGNVTLGDAPPNHMSGGGSKGGARPTDHTLHFRKNHGEQAVAKDSACRRCHTELQGNREDMCFQCHTVMRPRDHNVMWRGDHGRDAQTDATRCAQCHAPETCSACHSIPPRSHTPIGDFRQGGHSELARLNLSSCMTCHTYEDTCIKCHRSTR